MRPFSPLSRKPFLALVFVAAFIFLYNVASHPRVSKSMKPTAYYDNYDEAVCLPQRLLSVHPPREKAKAAFVILVRNREKDDIAATIRNLEDKFNKNFHYPYVFLNNEPFTDEFKDAMRAASPAEMQFGLVPKEQWSYPAFVNETYAAECRQRMEAENVFYGGMESYHHMCRYQSGFFFRHPLLNEYEWYWRVEPGVRFFCDITYDPFLYMQKNGKKYGFVVTLLELRETIPSLWQTVLDYARSRHINLDSPGKLFPYFRDETTGDYNLCHFWSNFEIASLNLWRSPSYRDFFDYLDRTGNFFYERWGDAPVHSLAAGLFLDTDEIHYFEDFGYQHDLYRHCPSKESRLGCRCECPEGSTETSIDHDHNWDTCLPRWRDWVKTSSSQTRRTAWNVWS